MSVPSIPFYPLTHDDGLRIISALDSIAESQARKIEIAKYEDIQKIVDAGNPEQYFNIGDQIVVPFEPVAGGTVYDLPFDVVHFGTAYDPDGNAYSNSMYLQSHYALVPVQFDGNEAFYVPTTNLAPGTYYFTIGTTWGSNCVSGKMYKFTTTVQVPAYGQLVLGTATSNTSGLPDTAPSNWRVRTYATGASETPLEILTLTEVSSGTGTNLGSLNSATKFSASGINNLQRSAYGYNRWSHSAMRQWLNSAAGIGDWWVQKNAFDHRPDQLSSIRGFLACLPEEFVSILSPVRVTTALNTVSDGDIGTLENTVDRFFCPSLVQEYIAPQLTGEGDPFDYWIERLDGTQHAQGGTRAEHIRYAYENHQSAQHVRVRSASRGYAHSTWSVYASGYASYGGTATYALRPAPACVIRKKS